MTRHEKVLRRVLSGTADDAIGFEELCGLLRRLGFGERQRRSSHRIFFRDGVQEILNLQPRGSHAKGYQVRQVREVVLKYGLAKELDPDGEKSDEA